MNEEEKELEWRRLSALEKEAGERMTGFTKAIYALDGCVYIDRYKATRALLGKDGYDKFARLTHTGDVCFLDHAYGISFPDGEIILVGEPYEIYEGMIGEMNRFCELFGLEWRISHEFRALHYPGHTTAIVFRKKEAKS